MLALLLLITFCISEFVKVKDNTSKAVFLNFAQGLHIPYQLVNFLPHVAMLRELAVTM